MSNTVLAEYTELYKSAAVELKVAALTRCPLRVIIK